MKPAGLLLIALSLTACHEVRRADSVSHHSNAPVALSGTFDNHEQVWRARESATGTPPPHVVIDVEPTADAAWTIWHVRLDANPAMDATWAMHGAAQAGGSFALTPHRSLAATPAPSSAFDAKQWTPLDACALRGAGAPLKSPRTPRLARRSRPASVRARRCFRSVSSARASGCMCASIPIRRAARTCARTRAKCAGSAAGPRSTVAVRRPTRRATTGT